MLRSSLRMAQRPSRFLDLNHNIWTSTISLRRLEDFTVKNGVFLSNLLYLILLVSNVMNWLEFFNLIAKNKVLKLKINLRGRNVKNIRDVQFYILHR